jgi:hypothetical protein
MSRGQRAALTDKRVGGEWVKLDAGRVIQFRWPSSELGRQMTWADIEDTKKSYGNTSLLRYKVTIRGQDIDEGRFESLRDAKKKAIEYALKEIAEEGFSFDDEGIPIVPVENPFPADYGEDAAIVSEHTAYGFQLEIFEYEDEYGFTLRDDDGELVEGTGYPSYQKAYAAGRSEAKKEAGG